FNHQNITLIFTEVQSKNQKKLASSHYHSMRWQKELNFLWKALYRNDRKNHFDDIIAIIKYINEDFIVYKSALECFCDFLLQ
ncbi:hypothetical protein, partial [Enterobacter bugandensis]|uniref:hypothetical protein n=1 Tax=Enterobacter bugandensis TaxID=881260 RepID=UPI002B061B73